MQTLWLQKSRWHGHWCNGALWWDAPPGGVHQHQTGVPSVRLDQIVDAGWCLSGAWMLSGRKGRMLLGGVWEHSLHLSHLTLLYETPALPVATLITTGMYHFVLARPWWHHKRHLVLYWCTEGGIWCTWHELTPKLPTFLDAIASPSTYPCQSVSGSVIDSFRLEIAIASPSFASLFFHTRHHLVDILYKYFSIFEKRRKEALVAVVISSHYPP